MPAPRLFVLLFASLLSGWAASGASHAAGPATPVVHMVGDSTMANKEQPDKNPEHGWGQVMPEFVAPGVTVENHAAGGRSTRSFIAEGRWDAVVKKLRAGDWVIIQFGHNDQKKNRPDLYTDPAGDYSRFLEKFVREARAKGARPVLATSILRRYFNKDGTPKNTLGGYPAATRAVAAALQVPLVDLNALTGRLLADSGEEGSKALFLHYEPGQNAFYPKGKHDNSHLSELGARKVAGLFVREMMRLDIGFPGRPVSPP